MLRTLRVRNFALMEDLTIEFGKGLTVITGETGAGKSMIVNAIAALCGERLDDTSIRTGKNFAEITGVFEVTPELGERIKKVGIESGGELIIRRKIERDARQSSYINDQIVSLGLVKELTGLLIDLIGQHENQSLFFPKNHLALLDGFAGVNDLKRKYRQDFDEYRLLETRLKELLEATKQRDDKIMYLRYQIDEIEKAKIQSGEEEKLNQEKHLLLNCERRSVLANDLVMMLYEAEGSVLERMFKVKKSLEELVAIDPSLSPLGERIESATLGLDDCYRTLRSYHDKIEFSQERLDVVLERLDIIDRIKKKYGGAVKEIGDYLLNAKKDLQAIETREEDIKKTESAIITVKEKVERTAEDLSAQRHKASVRLRKKILELIKRLGMEKAEFEIRISEKELDIDGKDNAEFYISTNPGEELKPLRRIASGGEISRITLALKTILSDVDRISTVIFDEVDTGIGGRIAEAVGSLLATVSKSHQVACITHLPQITIFADDHILVKKEFRGKQTFAQIFKLDEAMRRLEIARMLGGKEITKKTIEHAAEILERAKPK